jgi:hypothetical protein
MRLFNMSLGFVLSLPLLASHGAHAQKFSDWSAPVNLWSSLQKGRFRKW